MDHISQHMKALETGQLDSNANDSAKLPREQLDRAMARVWTVMVESYGRRWVNEYGDIGGGPYIRWCDTLANLSLEQIKRAVDSVASKGSPHPPNLFEFKAMCEGTDSELAEVEQEILRWATQGGGHFRTDLAFTVSLVLGQSDIRAMTHHEIRHKLPGAIRAAKASIKPRPVADTHQPRLGKDTGPKQTETGRQWLRKIRDVVDAMPSTQAKPKPRPTELALPDTCQNHGCGQPLPNGWQYVWCPACHDQEAEDVA